MVASVPRPTFPLVDSIDVLHRGNNNTTRDLEIENAHYTSWCQSPMALFHAFLLEIAGGMKPTLNL